MHRVCTLKPGKDGASEATTAQRSAVQVTRREVEQSHAQKGAREEGGCDNFSQKHLRKKILRPGYLTRRVAATLSKSSRRRLRASLLRRRPLPAQKVVGMARAIPGGVYALQRGAPRRFLGRLSRGRLRAYIGKPWGLPLGDYPAPFELHDVATPYGAGASLF